MTNENLPDPFPVCQALRARVTSDPVVAAQWRSLIADLREVFAAQLTRRRAVPEGCTRRDDPPPGVTARL